MRYEWKVESYDANVSLLSFLQEKLKGSGFSMRKIKGWIDAGYCSILNRPERFSRTSIKAGQSIVLEVRERKSLPLQIIYEDDACIVLDKPEGITCDERLLKDFAKKNKHVELVHRLDKGTTGLLLLAKTAIAKDFFINQFRTREIEKIYVAIVDKVVIKDHGCIENYLGPIQRYQGHVKWGEVHANGYFASTKWHVLQRTKNATYLQFAPKTGKTHQIRVHASGMGHPILGDYTYAKKFFCPYSINRVLLHAKTLRFCHPDTQKMMSFTAPLPDDFIMCLKELF